MQNRSRILIVDDHPNNIFVIEELLNNAYHVATAATGEEALAIAPDFLPDLILLDIMMPGIDGYETCRRLRTISSLQHTKIMMVSAKAMVSERLQGYEAGANDYITKPFEKEELLAKVRVYLQLKSEEEINQTKSKMYALLNHETRSPLHGILVPIRELKTNEALDTAEKTIFLEMIEQSATRLQRLCEKVHTLSIMKAGQWAFQFMSMTLGEIVRSAIHNVTSRISTCDIVFEPEPDVDLRVMADPQQMVEVITAMLENAIQFSPLEAQVVVGIRRDDEYCYATISDEGDGIDPALLPHVFEEFGHPNGMHHTKGYGLSLAIARQVMMAHQGTIQVESTKGLGTTFTLQLPVASS